MGRVDLSGFNKKIKALERLAERQLPDFLDDAAAYTLQRLTDEVLNGQGGQDYPKSYPSSVSEGQTGFVGVITRDLRGSQGIRKQGRFERLIKQVQTARAPYQESVNEWARRKYGFDFYEITVKLYGGMVKKQIDNTINSFVRRTNAGAVYKYRNPFPA